MRCSIFGCAVCLFCSLNFQFKTDKNDEKSPQKTPKNKLQTKETSATWTTAVNTSPAISLRPSRCLYLKWQFFCHRCSIQSRCAFSRCFSFFESLLRKGPMPSLPKCFTKTLFRCQRFDQLVCGYIFRKDAGIRARFSFFTGRGRFFRTIFSAALEIFWHLFDAFSATLLDRFRFKLTILSLQTR